MEYLPNSSILCLTYEELVPKIIGESNYKQLKSRGGIIVHGVGGNGRNILVEYETMPPKYRALVRAKFGDPYEYHSKQPLLKLIKDDLAAREFYASYPLENGSTLSPAHQLRYTRTAEWLNMINLVLGDKRTLKQELRITIMKFWDNVIELAANDKYEHDLPTSRENINKKLKKYQSEGYAGLITGRLGNQNRRKVSPLIERLIISLYIQENKPYHTEVVKAYERFMTGSHQVVDFQTGELLNRSDYYVNGEPYLVTDSTVYRYLNTPLARAVVDKVRMSDLQYAATHAPFMQRLAPVYAFSKITADDTSSPFKQHNGVRPATYKVFDVASGALVAMVMHREARPDVSLIRKLLADMMTLIVRQGWRMPAEIEVERALMTGLAGGVDADGKVQNDVLTAGEMFQYVRFCAPKNPQEKRAEGFIKAIKYGYQKHRVGFQHRPFARLEANRMNGDSASHAARFDFEEILAFELEDMQLYNNDPHPDQDKYPGMTRWQVLEQCQNPNLALPNLPLIMPYIGRKTKTSVRRGFIQVQENSYRFDHISRLADLSTDQLLAYWLPNEEGEADQVYLYQDGVFICQAEKVVRYQDAKAEQTDEDRRIMGRQMAYVKGHEALVNNTLAGMQQVGLIASEKAQRHLDTAQSTPVIAQGYDREDHAADDWVAAEMDTETPPKKTKKTVENAREMQKNASKEGGYAQNESPKSNPWLDLQAIAARANATI